MNKIGKPHHLDFFYMGIKDSNIEEICEYLSKLDGEIEFLSLAHNKITSKGASALFNYLRKNNLKVKWISLSDNPVGDNCFESLGNYIKNNQYIEGLCFGNYYSYTLNTITERGIEILSNYLEGNKTFKRLQLYGNQSMNDESIPLFLKLINNSGIDFLSCGSDHISQKNVFVVPLALNALRNGYDELFLNKSSMEDGDLIKICELIKKYGCDKLKVIILNNSNLSSIVISTFFETLKQTKTNIKKLNLFRNGLKDECMKSIGEFIESNGVTEEISFYDNNISDEGIETLYPYLEGNTTLKKLELHGNKGITDKSVPYLIDIVKKSAITSLNIEYLSISKESQTEIHKLVKIPIEEREIPIKSSSKSAAKNFKVVTTKVINHLSFPDDNQPLERNLVENLIDEPEFPIISLLKLAGNLV